MQKKAKKKINDDGTVFFSRKVPLHHREKLATANKKTKDYDAVFLRQAPLEVSEGNPKKPKALMTQILSNKFFCTLEKY